MPLIAVVSFGQCFMLRHRGLTATLAGSALALLVYSFAFNFTAGPFDPRGTRVRAVFVCLTAVVGVAAAIAVAESLMQGHWR